MSLPRCADCRRVLTDPASAVRGYGPVCADRRGLIPRRTPRAAAPASETPDVHPDQTALPIQMEITC